MAALKQPTNNTMRDAIEDLAVLLRRFNGTLALRFAMSNEQLQTLMSIVLEAEKSSGVMLKYLDLSHNHLRNAFALAEALKVYCAHVCVLKWNGGSCRKLFMFA